MGSFLCIKACYTHLHRLRIPYVTWKYSQNHHICTAMTLEQYLQVYKIPAVSGVSHIYINGSSKRVMVTGHRMN